MITDLKFKPNAARSVERFEAWWTGQLLDRPPVTLYTKPTRAYEGPVSQHTTQRQRWMDVEFVVDSAIANMAMSDHSGDTLPAFQPNLGPEITATLFGCDLDFSRDSSWSRPVVHCAEDWEPILAQPPNFDNEYWQTIERLTDLAIQRADGRYLVGITDLHGNYDILAALRDPQMLCLDVLDCPELLQRVGRHVADGFVAAFDRSYRKIAAAGFGTTCWMGFHHSGPAYVPSSDFWCMVSSQAAEELVLPDILREMQPLQRSIFHLDGPQALRHLDLLLALPQLNAVQWVYGEGNGPASRWIEVYQRCLAAGKSVEVLANDPADALAVVEQIGMAGVWLNIGKPFERTQDADAFLQHLQHHAK